MNNQDFKVLTNIIGIKFKKEGRIYNFNAVDLILHKGDQVLVNTDNGIALGTVVTDVHRCEPSGMPPNLKSVVRKVTADDLRVREELELLEEEARKYCMGKIAEKSLNMKLITVECLFDRSKMIFYFTADSRVDFRELVKDLDRVTVKMAKEQSMSLNPEKISGLCGRLMCCLSFEHEGYAGTKKCPRGAKTATTQDAVEQPPQAKHKITDARETNQKKTDS
ncbi:MAG: hypothetical protein CVU51_11210 [Deltaproteobacteria bacterium HGW-Deltaproteobacteria-1]|nr:MAG: hypothetical protein CVU51_11210 [Deltaproteobacteria bacterium HGW-Deltaproteobacteria-1]